MKSENILNSKEELVDDGWGDCWEGTIPVGAKLRLKIDGSLLLDNQALCIMLNISKRTLQRYRAMGLVCKRIRRKTYYLESDVQRFMADNLTTWVPPSEKKEAKVQQKVLATT